MTDDTETTNEGASALGASPQSPTGRTFILRGFDVHIDGEWLLAQDAQLPAFDADLTSLEGRTLLHIGALGPMTPAIAAVVRNTIRADELRMREALGQSTYFDTEMSYRDAYGYPSDPYPEPPDLALKVEADAEFREPQKTRDERAVYRRPGPGVPKNPFHHDGKRHSIRDTRRK